MTDSVTQRGIVGAVAARGYLEGYTLDQRIARQLVKQLEETCEAMQALEANDTGLYGLAQLIGNAGAMMRHARAVFDVPALFDGVAIDVPTLIEELPDMVVPLAVLADALGMDMMAAGLDKAQADVARGVRNGNQRA